MSLGRCTRHRIRNCSVCRSRRYGGPSYGGYNDPSDNFGDVSITSDGDLAVGIGGGLSVDDDGLNVQVAPGLSVDTSPDTDSGGSDSSDWDSGGGDWGSDSGGGGDF
jgi:hypothetical protein